MTLHASQAWVVALEFLGDAERVVPSIMPRVATHAAYYAMFHAARAVLLQIDGDRAPLKHTAVVGRFGQLAKTRDDPLLRIAGRLINRVLEARVDADYNVRHPTDSLTAMTAIQSARQFIEICSGAFGFPAPLP